MARALTIAGACALLAGCGQQANPRNEVAGSEVTVASPTATRTPPRIAPTDAWIGTWRGVEGLALDISPAARRGAYRLHMSLMDTSGDYAGVADGNVIRFRRDGVTETIRHTAGTATGLKWLAEKKDCLTIKEGVGFCRD